MLSSPGTLKFIEKISCDSADSLLVLNRQALKSLVPKSRPLPRRQINLQPGSHKFDSLFIYLIVDYFSGKKRAIAVPESSDEDVFNPRLETEFFEAFLVLTFFKSC